VIVTAPQRLCLSRTKGFRLQDASLALNGRKAISCTRGSRWGNPFIVSAIRQAILFGTDWSSIPVAGSGLWNAFFRSDPFPPDEIRELAQGIAHQAAVELHRELVWRFEATSPQTFEHWIAPLRGHNLACWCGPDTVCHTETLLELANR